MNLDVWLMLLLDPHAAWHRVVLGHVSQKSTADFLALKPVITVTFAAAG